MLGFSLLGKVLMSIKERKEKYKLITCFIALPSILIRQLILPLSSYTLLLLMLSEMNKTKKESLSMLKKKEKENQLYAKM